MTVRGTRMNAAAVLFALILTPALRGQGPSGVRLTSLTMPHYPPMSLLAHISGTVKLSVLVNDKGEATEVRVISGHAMLSGAAADNVKTWRFENSAGVRREIEFVYRISGEGPVQEGPHERITFTPPDRVEIEAQAPWVETNSKH